MRIAYAVLVFGLVVSASPANLVVAQSGSCEGGLPLTQADVEVFLGLGPEGALRRVLNCGVTFILDAAGEQRLRGLGANDALIAVLAPPKNPSARTAWTPRTDHRPLIWQPSGTFEMGSPATEAGRDVSETPHTVQVAGFWIDESEVTKEAYRRFLLDTPAWQKARAPMTKRDANYLKDWTGNDFPAGEGKSPVVSVSWPAAAAYAAWAGKRLATESEWEFAARAGTKTAYWWGDRFDAPRVSPAAPADTARNPGGLLQMLGGVWEWTASLYRPYPYRSADGREDPQASGDRVLRGGATAYGERFLRSANRNSAPPELTSDKVGFRCAR